MTMIAVMMKLPPMSMLPSLDDVQDSENDQNQNHDDQ
jgi:hypothetical protein